jgi:hypothetical protein
MEPRHCLLPTCTKPLVRRPHEKQWAFNRRRYCHIGHYQDHKKLNWKAAERKVPAWRKPRQCEALVWLPQHEPGCPGTFMPRRSCARYSEECRGKVYRKQRGILRQRAEYKLPKEARPKRQTPERVPDFSAEDRARMTRTLEEMSRKLASTVRIYSCETMSQDELRALIP